MRGEDQQSEGIFSYLRLEQRIAADHPLRAIRELVDAALKGCRETSTSFMRGTADLRSLRSGLLRATAAASTLHGTVGAAVRRSSSTTICCSAGSSGCRSTTRSGTATVFCKNRDRLLDGDIAAKFFVAVLNLPQVRKLLSSEHFSVDGTLIEAWASMKSFVPKDGGDPPSGQGPMAAVDATPSATSMAKSARTTRIPRPPTRTPGCSARAPARRPSFVTWGI